MRHKVLLVDDEPVARRIANKILKNSYDIVEADSVAGALEVLGGNDVSLIISDVKMPGKDGVYLLELLKNSHPKIPVLLVTALGDREIVIDFFKKGAFDYIEKPYKSTLLLAAAERAIEYADMQVNLAKVEANSIQTQRLASVGLMAGSVAHEISSPLSLLTMKSNMMLELGKRGKLDEKKSIEFVEDILTSVRKINSIINSLKTIAYCATSAQFENVTLQKVVEDAVALLRDWLHFDKIDLRLPEFPDDLKLYCDRVEIAQLVFNLLHNAADAVKGLDDAWIKVDFERHAEYLEILIVDSGYGIASEISPIVFEPFFTTKAVGSGTGLGLSICRQLAEKHFGKVELADECEHTTFRVTLPYDGPNYKAKKFVA